MLDNQSSTFIYRQLANIIRKQILAGELKPGDKLLSEFDMVAQYRISRSSVRQAIELLVKEGLVEKVQGKGNFVFNWMASDVQGGTIGLLVPDTRLSLFMNILNGVEAAAKARGYSLVFNYLGKNDKEEMELVQRLKAQSVSGFVIFPHNNNSYDGAIWQLFEEGFPFVLIDRYFPDLPCAFVGVDNFTAAYQAVEHLIQLGHRSIGFGTLSDLSTTTLRDRFAGYQKALSDYGIAFDENWLCRSPSLYDSPVYTEADEINEIGSYRKFFQKRHLPSALFVINDHTAYLVYCAAKAEGIRVPEDLALVGFDDDEFAKLNEVPLTTVGQPFYDIGARAANLLIDKLRGIQTGLQRIMLPTRLIIRQSSAKQTPMTEMPRADIPIAL
jgi:GntR family transcriptional regulator, arabinose operon transcriptional repressor